MDKTPEPFRVLEKSRDGIFKGRFTARAQPDFQGTLEGGRSIVFEAKYTTADRLKWDVLTQEQRDALEHHPRHGAISAVCAGIGNDFLLFRGEVWRDMKRMFRQKNTSPRRTSNHVGSGSMERFYSSTTPADRRGGGFAGRTAIWNGETGNEKGKQTGN